MGGVGCGVWQTRPPEDTVVKDDRAKRIPIAAPRKSMVESALAEIAPRIAAESASMIAQNA
jgi:hypothetical protein